MSNKKWINKGPLGMTFQIASHFFIKVWRKVTNIAELMPNMSNSIEPILSS